MEINWVRRTLSSGDAYAATAILYGGSVNSENIKDYLQDSRIGGVLIGSASANIGELGRIAEVLKQVH